MFVLITCVFILFGLKERKFTILFSSSSRNLVSFPLSHFLFWANGDCFYFLFLSISWYTFHLHNLAGDLERWKKPQILVRCEIFMDALHLSLCLALFNFLPLMWSYVCSIRVPRITLPFSLLLIILAGSICLLCILSSIWWDWSFYFFFFFFGMVLPDKHIQRQGSYAVTKLPNVAYVQWFVQVLSFQSELSGPLIWTAVVVLYDHIFFF